MERSEVGRNATSGHVRLLVSGRFWKAKVFETTTAGAWPLGHYNFVRSGHP